MRLNFLPILLVAAGVSGGTPAYSAFAQTALCGRPVAGTGTPGVRDALVILRSAVDIDDCDPALCDVTADCLVTATDSRTVLAAAAHLDHRFDCSADCSGLPCEDGVAPMCGGFCPDAGRCTYMDLEETVAAARSCGRRAIERDGDPDSGADSDSGSAGDSDSDSDSAEGNGDAAPAPGACACVPAVAPSSTSTTTTSSVTLPDPVDAEPPTTTLPVADPATTSTTRTTTTTSTTTTTNDTTSDIDAGRALYDNGCAVCHRAGSHDGDGFAGNIAGKGGRLRTNLTGIAGAHASIAEPPGPTLSDQELRELTAFLNSL